MSQPHTIQQFALELRLPRGTDALPLQERARLHLYDELLPRLEQLFEEWVGEGEILEIPRLEIDLGQLSAKELENGLAEKIIACMQERYKTMQTESSEAGTAIRKISLPQARFDSWLYYLEHGYLPTHTATPAPEAWDTLVLETLASSNTALEQCKQTLQSNAMALRRMVQQHTAAFLAQWIAAFSGQRYRDATQQLQAWENIFYNTTLQQALSTNKISLQLPTVADFRARHYHWLIGNFILPARDVDGTALLQEILRQQLVADNRALWLAVMAALLANDPASLTPALRAAHQQLITQLSMGEVQQQLSSALVTLASVRPLLQRSLAQLQEHYGTTTNFIQQDVRNTAAPGQDPTPVPDVVVHDADTIKQQNNTQDLSWEKSNEPMINEQADASEQLPDGTALYVQQAGLVLLHPFLPAFFKNVDLLDGKAFKNDEARALAVHLLHFLASGETEQPDHGLILPKLLCGMRPAQTLPRFVPLEPALQEAARGLLEAVLQHWNALGNTSPDGLRANFLLREGRLLEQQEEWRLRVTQRAYDLLLERLPWTISIIKLPWMPQFLKTEWT